MKKISKTSISVVLISLFSVGAYANNLVPASCKHNTNIMFPNVYNCPPTVSLTLELCNFLQITPPCLSGIQGGSQLQYYPKNAEFLYTLQCVTKQGVPGTWSVVSKNPKITIKCTDQFPFNASNAERIEKQLP